MTIVFDVLNNFDDLGLFFNKLKIPSSEFIMKIINFYIKILHLKRPIIG